MRTLILLFIGLISTPLHATLSAYLDKNPLLAGETVTLTIRSESGKDDPDLSALEQDFQILGRSSSSQIRMVNGTTTRTHDWLIQLRPKRLGTLQIPAIRVGQAQTDPITLEVRKPELAQGQLPEAFIEFEDPLGLVPLVEDDGVLCVAQGTRLEASSGVVVGPVVDNGRHDSELGDTLVGAVQISHRHPPWIVLRDYRKYFDTSGRPPASCRPRVPSDSGAPLTCLNPSGMSS